MRRVWAIVAVVVALLSIVALVLICNTNHKESLEQAPEVEYNGIVAEYNGEGVCEVLVDMGYVKASSTTITNIRIINRSSAPLVLLDYSTQCRCMWLDLNREPIAPGDKCDIELYFDSRGEWGSVGNFMEITTSNEASPVVLWIGAEVESGM